MGGTTALSRAIAAAFLSLAFCPSARAAEDTQFWLTASASTKIDPHTTLQFDVSPRARSDRAGGDQLLLRVTADRAMNGWLNLGIGAVHVATPGSDEWRAHQQFTLTHGVFSSRTRLEERFFTGADRAQLRLRERLRALVPLDPKDSLDFTGELFAIVRSQTVGARSRIDQWRFYAGVRRKLSSRFDVAGGYMLAIAPVAGRPDKLSHIPQVAVSFSF